MHLQSMVLTHQVNSSVDVIVHGIENVLQCLAVPAWKEIARAWTGAHLH